MRKSTYISAAVAIVACLLVFFWQSNRIAALEARTRSHANDATALDRSNSEANKPSTGSEKETGDGNQATASTQAPTAEELRALWPNGIDIRDYTAIATAIPKFVEAVEGCSTAQLLEIAEDLIDSNPRRSDRLITKFLLILAAEEDPASALSFWDDHHQSIDQYELVRSAILGQLAKKDLPLALERIEREAIHPNDLRRSRIAVAQQLLKHDIDAGLALLAKGSYCDPCMILGGLAHGFYNSDIAITVAASDPQVAKNLWQKANHSYPNREREVLLSGLFEIEAIERGAEGLSKAYSKIENLDEKLSQQLLFNASLNVRRSDPAGTIQLFRDHGSGDRPPKVILEIFEDWSKDSLPEASSWLETQPATPERDRLIISLADKIKGSNPAAALGWAEQIGDEALRAEALSRLE